MNEKMMKVVMGLNNGVCNLPVRIDAGCFLRCMQCLRLVPWASLIATMLCWAGTALFCGAGHEALTYTMILLNSTSGLSNEAVFDVFQALQYAIYGIAGYMLLLTIILFIDGVLVSQTVKKDFSDGCKSTSCGMCFGVMNTILSYLTSSGWLLLACLAALPVAFCLSVSSQCTFITESCTGTADCSSVCIDFVQAGLLPPQINLSGYGKLCDDQLTSFCNNAEFQLVYQLYIIAFVGAAVTVLSMKQFLMCLSANFAYLKMARKLVEYEDAKYREEMELNDIINTARSNERLTH